MKTQTLKAVLIVTLIAIFSLGSFAFNTSNDLVITSKDVKTQPTLHKNVTINGLNIFYREAGDINKPTILLLHGYPTSSHMFRNLITDLSVQYHVLAPDYPGFGRSDQQATDNASADQV